MKTFILSLILGLLSFSSIADSRGSCKVMTTESPSFNQLLKNKGYEIVDNQNDANIFLLVNVSVKNIRAFSINYNVNLVLSSLIDPSRVIELNGEDVKNKSITFNAANSFQYDIAFNVANREIPRCEFLGLN